MKIKPSLNRLRIHAGAMFIGLLLPATTHAQINRQQAVDALLHPGSGVPINPDLSTVWSPFVNFSFGPGFEGLLPAGTDVSPTETGTRPFPGPGMTVSNASYFFWIDDKPAAGFSHPTRFVLLDAFHGSPSVSNGAIRVTEQGWWPKVTTSNGPTIEFFSTDTLRTSDAPPGPENTNGFILGFASNLADFTPVTPTTHPGGTGPAAALIVRGSGESWMSNMVNVLENDLREHFQVNSSRIIKANDGLPATYAQFAAAVSNLCNLQPPPKEVFIRLVSHGTDGGFRLADGTISAWELRNLLQPIADKGVPVFLFVFACHSGSLIPAVLGTLPVGSTMVTAASAGQLTWMGDFDVGSAAPYVHAFSQALRLDPASNPELDVNGDGFVDDVEANAWIVRQKPGFTAKRDGRVYYPAGPPLGQIGDNPNPQARVRGGNPLITSHQVSNGTDEDKTDYHIGATGNVTNGLQTFQTRVAEDGLPLPTLGFTNPPAITFDPQQNETRLDWQDTNSPVPPGSRIIVTVFHPQGALQGIRQYWTPTPQPVTPPNRVPGSGSFYRIPQEGSNMVIHIINPRTPEGETDPPKDFKLRVGYSTSLFPLKDFHSANPAVSNLQATATNEFTLPPDRDLEIEVPVAPQPETAPLPSVVITVEKTWSLNGNSVTELAAGPLPLPPEDTECITNCPHQGVFMTVNSPGPNSVFQWHKDGQPLAGETNATLTLLDLKGIDEGIYTGIAVSGGLVKRKFFKLFIVDNTPPTINCPSNIVVECQNNGGAIVNYSVSASDNCGGPVTIQADPPPGSFFPLGTTHVSVIARDSFQNPAVCVFTITVVDTTPPQIFCQPSQVFTSSFPIVFTFGGGAFDACEGALPAQCDPPSGATFFPGTVTTVTCRARDSSGNENECSFTVTVERPGGSTVQAAGDGATLTLTWGNPDALLQCAPQVTGSYSTISTASSPYTVPISPSQAEEYFRLFFPDSLSFLQSAFASPEPVGADIGYAQLYKFSLNANDIEALMQLTGVTNPYAGSAYQHPDSSRLASQPPSTRLVAILAVDGILHDTETAHYAPAFISATPMTAAQKEQQAVTAYQQWWFFNQDKTIQQLREGPHPLASTGLRWHGPLKPNPNAPPEGTVVPGSLTPFYRYTNNPVVEQINAYSIVMRPAQLGGPTPYNSLAWAVNCYTDRWIDLPFTNSAVWQIILTDHGYNVAGGPVSCNGTCPSGDKIQMIFHVGPNETPNDENWVHAIKQQPDGNWSSKNGQGPLFENISNPEAFLNKHYPVPAGLTRVVRCYCE